MKIIACAIPGYNYISKNYGVTWTSSTYGNWTCVAASPDLATIVGGASDSLIYTSSDYGNTWRIGLSTIPRRWSYFVSLKNGTNFLASMSSGQIYTIQPATFNLKASTDIMSSWPSGTSSWSSIASSTDGKYLAAVMFNGLIYTSVDYGVSWIKKGTTPVSPVSPVATSLRWQDIASSSDGKYLVGVVYNGNIFTSNDYGETWTERIITSFKNWHCVNSSADGSKLAAGVSNGLIWISSNYGVDWTPSNSISANWKTISSSADGQYLVAGINGGKMYRSINYGLDWTTKETVNRNWYSSASSSDGSRVVAVVYDNYIYTSTNYGETWTAKTNTTRIWWSVAASLDLKNIFAVVKGGYIYTSPDYGENWFERQIDSVVNNWTAVVSSGDGTKCWATVDVSGVIYIYNTITALPPVYM